MDLVHARTGLAEDDVLSMIVETHIARCPQPVEHRWVLPRRGVRHGGRPGAARLAQARRLDPRGLFLTGSTAHPGGSVSGRPGRNAARAVLGS